MERQTCLLAGETAEIFKEFTASLGILPVLTIKLIVKATSLGCHPDLMQRLLQVDHDLRTVGKHQGHHAANALRVDIGVRVIVESVAGLLHGQQQLLGFIKVFKVNPGVC